MRPFLLAAILLSLLPTANAKTAKTGNATPTQPVAPPPKTGAVVHLAPDFAFPAAGNKLHTLRSLRGRAVLVVIADTPRSRAFRKQIAQLRRIYEEFASKQVIFAAVLGADENEIKTDIPFVIVNNAASVAAAYGVQHGFSIAIIGKDGNVDYQTDRVTPPERIRDVIQNSFAVQAPARN